MPVLARAVEALREVTGDSFKAEVTVGPTATREKEIPRDADRQRRTDEPGGTDRQRETGLLTVHRGPERWSFQVLEVGRLTEERAARLLSSADFGVSKGEKGNAGNEKGSAGKEKRSAPPLLVSECVTGGTADLLQAEDICYIDTAGNCYLRSGSLFIFVRGQKPSGEPASQRPNRAFEDAGLKLIFALLAREEAAGWTYRRLSGVVGISRGAVGYVMEDLRRLGFLEEIGGERRLRRRPELLERWAGPFAERLRPKLLRGRFAFVEEKRKTEWRKLAFDPAETQWGGEPATELLVGNLRPKRFSLYTQKDTPEICGKLGLAPDENGAVELLEMFWDPQSLKWASSGEAGADDLSDLSRSVPPILAYGDLIARADSRAIEAARRLREEHLDWNSPL